MRIRRRNGHIAALGQFRRIRPPLTPTEADHHFVPHFVVGRMQTQHRRCLAALDDEHRFRNAKISRRARAGLRLKRDELPEIFSRVHFLLHLHIQPHPPRLPRQRPHHRHHPLQNLRPPQFPIRRSLHRLHYALGIAELQKV